MSVDSRIREGLTMLENQLPQVDTFERYDELRSRITKDAQRRWAGAGIAAAAAVAVTVGAFALSGGERSQTPSPAVDPSPSPTMSTGADWTPERIRAEGRPGDPQGAISTESGLATRLYEVCDGTRCDFLDDPPEDLHVALEVTQDGRSAVFDLHFTQQPWVRAFDEDSVLVQDPALVDYARNGPARFRLLQADGTAVELELLDNPAAAVPGSGVEFIERYDALLMGTEEPYLIDDRAGTLRPLDAPADVRYWGPNADEFLWGVTDDCRVVWTTSGTFEEHQLDCSGQYSIGIADELPAGWQRPGRMVIHETDDQGNPMFIQVSLDRGVTWQRIPIGEDETVASVLQQLG